MKTSVPPINLTPTKPIKGTIRHGECKACGRRFPDAADADLTVCPWSDCPSKVQP